MKTGCIKTGCIVQFPQYGQTISADVYRVGGALVIKTHPNQIDCGDNQDPRTPDLIVESDQSISGDFWRPDLGVFVVPEFSYNWTDTNHP